MAKSDELHIVMFPWLAFGHMIPFLELSKGLAQKGHRISYISTPRNIERLPKLPPNLSPLINFVKLPLPQVENLPEKAEATSDVPFDKIQYLKKAFDGLNGSFTRFVESSAPNYIIHDFTHHWVPPIAAKSGVPCAFFSIFNASFIAFWGSPWPEIAGEDTRTMAEDFTIPPKFFPSSSNIAFSHYEIHKIFGSLGENAAGMSDKDRLFSTIFETNFIVMRSCEEVEGDYLSIMREKLYRIPVIPIGLLPPLGEDHTLENKEDEWVNIKSWLDKQREGSVVYIAFGSEAELRREEMHEIALGLELSGLSFFWTSRKPMLPSGFENRTQDQGFISLGWAPQRRILAHPSVGAFLTHCGWSSVIESLAMGCPLVLLPLSTDQPLIAKLLQSKNIGVAIPRDEFDGSFTRDSVAKSLRLVIVDSDGELHKAKAREMRELFGDKGRHDQRMDELDQYLRNHCC